jgi:hypothetical protein
MLSVTQTQGVERYWIISWKDRQLNYRGVGEWKTNKCINHSVYWQSIFSYMFRHFRRMGAVYCNRRRDGRDITGFLIINGLLHPVISRPSRCLLQYKAPILICFPRHWALISAGSCLTSWWWHFKGPKRVGEYWLQIHWMVNAFVGFSFTLRKFMVQNANIVE